MEKIKVKNTGAADKASVEKLWKDYEAAQSSDRPERQLEILSAIKKETARLRMPWDFYRAGQLYVNVALSRDWKLRDSLRAAFKKEIEEFDEPVMTYYDGRFTGTAKKDFAVTHRAELERGRNTGFWENDGNFCGRSFGAALLKFTENDYQYVLWSMGEKELLAEALGDKYPCAQLLEFESLLRLDEFRRKEYLEEFAKKYDGKAVALLAKEELLQMEFSDLVRNDAESEKYKALRARCAGFEKERAGYTGDGRIIADCCTRVAGLIEEMDSRNLSFSITDGVLELSLRNLDGADLTVKDGKSTVLSTRLDNTSGSYYASDTVRFTLPDLSDGEYTVTCRNGKTKQEETYQKYSLSMSLRHDAEGFSAVVADAVSGEPVSKADFTLYKEDTVMDELKDVSLDGFTRLPATFFARMDDRKWEFRLECSLMDSDGKLRKTRKCSINESYRRDGITYDRAYAQLFVDRSAFSPDDTVRFKAVLYHGDQQHGVKAQEAGHKFQVSLFNAENELLETRDLTTGEFGSAAGSFVLKRGQRNGSYRLSIIDGGSILAERSVTVDDFVLPSFELTFDPDDKLFFPGDEVTVSGKLQSFSGHSLSSADIRCIVTCNGNSVLDKALKPESDGTFTIAFPSEKNDWQSFNIEVRVTDVTGETLEWSTSRTVRTNIPFSASLVNRSDATLSLSKVHEYVPDESYSNVTTDSDLFIIKLKNSDWRTAELDRPTLRITYTLSLNGQTIAEGTARPGEELRLDTSPHPSGLYTFSAKASDTDIYGNTRKATVILDILKVNDNDNALFCDVTYLYKVIDDGNGSVGLLIGSTEGPVWACVDLYGADNRLLGSRLVHLTGGKGKAGSLEKVTFGWDGSWSDVVRIYVIYFKKYRQYTFQHDFDRSAERTALPLSFTRFVDRTTPRSQISLEIATAPGVECAATVFDKSTEAIAANIWKKLPQHSPERPTVSFCTVTGSNGLEYSPRYRLAATKGAPAPEPMAMEETYQANDMVAMGSMAEAEELDLENVSVRENFANTIAFEPFLRSDSEGLIRFDLTAADKLSTYYVQLFAHDKDMNNAALRREMMVTIPVKVAVTEPQFLYSGDLYNVKASLSSNAAESISGTLRVDFYDGGEYKGKAPFKSLSKKVEVGAMSSLAEEFPIEVTSVDALGMLVSFIADDKSAGSDALFVTVPVLPAEQTITEAHSSILHTGESRESLLLELSSQFVNGTADDARMNEISVLDMVREAIPAKVEPASENVLDLSEALYARLLAASLGSPAASRASMSNETILSKIDGCRNPDGGYAWFKDMESAPVITAVLLQRYAGLKSRGIGTGGIKEENVTDAVKYLDSSYFSAGGRPVWRGGITFEQYISVRSMFPEVPFSAKDADKTKLKDFKKEVKEFLTPSKERGLNGQILRKARRIRTLLNLSGSENGKALAQAWGIKFNTLNRLRSSCNADLESLQEYAIAHRSGGWYYPNAVMPLRGLLESEAYAHSFIADLFKDCGIQDTVAEGIRLWLMIQKETQDWDDDPAFVEAIATIMDASQATLGTKVITLAKDFTKPFSEIESSGNGMTIECRYLLDGKEISEGQKLEAGDRITAEYRIWNEENRSFVRLTAYRPAAFRPVEQLSGPVHSFIYKGYRSVLKDRTEFWYESYPEEITTVTEDLFVTQAGTFQCPALVIESLYAPHYRANSTPFALYPSPVR